MQEVNFTQYAHLRDEMLYWVLVYLLCRIDHTALTRTVKVLVTIR